MIIGNIKKNAFEKLGNSFYSDNFVYLSFCYRIAYILIVVIFSINSYFTYQQLLIKNVKPFIFFIQWIIGVIITLQIPYVPYYFSFDRKAMLILEGDKNYDYKEMLYYYKKDIGKVLSLHLLKYFYSYLWIITIIGHFIKFFSYRMAIMIGLPFLFSTILLSMDNYEFFSLFIVATFLTHLFILLLTIFILFRLYNNKKLRLVFIGLISFGFIFLAGTIMYFNYDKSLEYDLENDNQLKEIVTLDKESSFKLDNNLPVLDGATALYPVYVSFANAVYPEYVKKDLSIKSEELKSDEYVKCSTTNEAYYNIINGHADIIFVALPSKEQEEMTKEKDITLEFIPIGRDAFVFL